MGFTTGMLEAVRRRFSAGPADGRGRPTGAEGSRRILVDANTQTFWTRGADAPTTLVEIDADLEPGPRPGHNVAAMLQAHERGRQDAGEGRPRGNPAFSEALFVELMRAQQYQRAFALLSPECQERWGSCEGFAAAQRGEGLKQLRGVNVVAVRHLEEWEDPNDGIRHRYVAELDVEYSFGRPDRPVLVRHTVHLVGVAGKWRSLCYPAGTAATAAG